MKKSFIAAAFAAALPVAVMAQDNEAPQTEPAEFCQPISATAQFCAAIGTNAFQIGTPNGQVFLGVPGRVEDGDRTLDECVLIVNPGHGPVGVQCAPPAAE